MPNIRCVGTVEPQALAHVWSTCLSDLNVVFMTCQ